MTKPELDDHPKHTKAGGDDWWFWEDTGGIDVKHRNRAQDSIGRPMVVATFRIPLASIRAYLRRLDGRR